MKEQIAIRLGYEDWREMEQLAKRQSGQSEIWPGVSSFAGVWAFLQTFRPSRAELDRWLDGSEDKKFEVGDGTTTQYWMTGSRVGERVQTRSHLLPSSIEIKDGISTKLIWYKPGSDSFGRDVGPAYIKRDAKGNVVWIEFWDGEHMHNNVAPAQIRNLTRDDDGRCFANFTFVKCGKWGKSFDFYERVGPVDSNIKKDGTEEASSTSQHGRGRRLRHDGDWAETFQYDPAVAEAFGLLRRRPPNR